MPGHTRVGFIAWFTLIAVIAVGMLCLSFPAASQPAPKVFRVGYLSAAGRTPDGAAPEPFREGLRSLGYVEGQNVAYQVRFAEGNIFKGAKPADLPAQQPTTYNLAVNLKTAATLGLTITPLLLIQTSDVVQ